MLQKLLLALNDSAWAFDLNKNEYVFLSPTIAQVFGVIPDELKADNELWQKIIFADDRVSVVNTTRQLTDGNQAEMFYRVKRKGKIHWLFEKKVCFTDDDTGNTILLGVVKDVTDQRTTHFHLKNSLGDFSVLFEKSNSPMWIYETPSLRILKVNDAAMDLYGYTEEEFLELTIRDLRPKIDLAKFNEYIFRKGITRGTMKGFNNGGIWKHVDKYGEPVYAEISGYEMKYNNTSCRIIIATNVTERIKFEQERDRIKQMNTSE